MATGIPYIDEVLNLVVGCTPVSAGCDHCYAATWHARWHKAWLAGKKVPKQYAKPFSEVQLFPERLAIPAKRRKPTRFMVCSMADLFHPGVPSTFIGQTWGMMRDAKRHTFLVFTTRIERAERMLSVSVQNPPSNIELIVSVEDQKTANERIPLLLECPVAVRGVSYEPALGPVDFHRWLDRIDWLIFGGESGKDARPCNDMWAFRALLQCREYDTAFYMKQRGACHGSDHADPKTFPKDLQVREYPEGTDK